MNGLITIRALGLRGLLTAMASLALMVGAAQAAGNSSKKSGSDGPKVYKWVDENGVPHYGDQVPAEDAKIDRVVLNQYGVPVGSEEGARTPEEIAAEKAAVAERMARARAAQRDQILLSTYLSVDEIQALRDRRMDLMEGQIRVTENYLGGLRAKLKGLQEEAAGFKPYSSDPAAPSIDEKLADELADTMDSIALYEKTLKDTRSKQQQLSVAFDADIARFRELRELDRATP